MAKKGYSRQGLFGTTIHYDSNGKKIGESRPGLFGMNHYDSQGNKVAESHQGFFGVNHYDTHGKKIGETRKGFFEEEKHW